MKAKEKAKELVGIFGKELALKCVDEIVKDRKHLEEEYDEDFFGSYGVEEYWQEVKQEINNL